MIAPQVLPEHPAPARLQWTAVLPVPVTVAVNRWVLPTTRVALVGETETPMLNEEPMKILAVPD